MKHQTLCLLLLGHSAFLLGQQDASQAVFTIFPSKGSVSEPKFSSFCLDRCWLGEQEFDLNTFRFVDKDSASCIPVSARPEGERWVNPVPQPNWWYEDPYDARYLWRYNYLMNIQSLSVNGVDTLIISRYDRQTGLQTAFHSMARGEMRLGKPGVWMTNRQEMVLLDRHTGKVLARNDQMEAGWTFSNLRPWGEDVIIADSWLYQRGTDRIVPFFPLPGDMEGCKSPDRVTFHGELCGSMVQDEQDEYVYYIIAPDQKPIKLPFKWGCCKRDFMVAVNPPLVWLSFPDKLFALDFITGDSLVYEGPTGEPLIEDQDGRFLGFGSEQGLSFFDKYSCAFRVRNLPYGYTKPRYFTSDARFIYLTYEDHWEILRFEMLDTAFNHSSVLEEFQKYEKERDTLINYWPDGFYPQYHAVKTLVDRYKDLHNAKIETDWEYLQRRLGYSLNTAPDTVMEQVSLDYAANRFEPALHCKVVESLFRYWGKAGALEKLLALQGTEENKQCLEMEGGVLWTLAEMAKATQYRLDSIQQCKIPPAERLYGIGRVWMDYCLKKHSFRYEQDPRGDLEPAFDFYRTLLRQYPNSPWCDNAAYDMFYFIDYHSTTSDDHTPDADDNQAYVLFNQFLKDYPDSDRKPDVLLRLARTILRGIEDKNQHTIPIDEAAQCLREIAQDYPDFARGNDRYQSVLGFFNAQNWALHWSLQSAFQQDTFPNRDSILLNIKLLNQSREPQTLDSVFFSYWEEGLQLQVYPIRGADCDHVSGSFPLLRLLPAAGLKAVTIAPGASYEEVYWLDQTLTSRHRGPRRFKIEAGSTYLYNLEFHHPKMSWLRVYANGGRFSVK